MNDTFQIMKHPERTIFMAHDAPYSYFDRIDNKASPMNGKHIGDIYALNLIKKYKPAFYVFSHMHEYQGIKKIGRTNIVTTGPGFEGKAAIIELDDDKRLGNVRFIK